MANVLTDLANDIYKAADMIGRELVGIIPSITINADGSEEVAVGDTVRSHFTRAATVGDITPAMTIPEGDDQTVDTKTLTISKERGVKIPWTGEDIKHVNNGAGFETIYGDQIIQAMRALVNEMESDLGTDIYQNAGNAVGTSGTNPFASNFDIIADGRQLLVDRGIPTNDRNVTTIVNSAAGKALRKLTQLQKANESGGTELLRQGELLDLLESRIKESAGIQNHTKGTGTLYDVDLVAGYDAGDTTVHVDTGSGTIKAGDIITFSAGNLYNGESRKAVVNTLVTPGSGDEDIIMNSGLFGSVADGEDVAIENSFAANLMLHKNAAELAIRAPANPIGGDAAVDRMLVQDPWSGMIFEISVYKGFKKMMILVGAVWGYKTWKPDAVVIVQG